MMKRVIAALVLCLGLMVSSAYSQNTQGQPQGEMLRFSNYGIGFNYPSSLKVSSDQKAGQANVMLESEESPFAMIRVYEKTAETTEIRSSLVKTFRDEYLSRNAAFPEESGKTVSREIGGIERKGQMLKLRFMDRPMNIEVYAFRKGDSVIGIVMQYAVEDFQLAERYFSAVFESLG